MNSANNNNTTGDLNDVGFATNLAPSENVPIESDFLLVIPATIRDASGAIQPTVTPTPPRHNNKFAMKKSNKKKLVRLKASDATLDSALEGAEGEDTQRAHIDFLPSSRAINVTHHNSAAEVTSRHGAFHVAGINDGGSLSETESGDDNESPSTAETYTLPESTFISQDHGEVSLSPPALRQVTTTDTLATPHILSADLVDEERERQRDAAVAALNHFQSLLTVAEGVHLVVPPTADAEGEAVLVANNSNKNKYIAAGCLLIMVAGLVVGVTVLFAVTGGNSSNNGNPMTTATEDPSGANNNSVSIKSSPTAEQQASANSPTTAPITAFPHGVKPFETVYELKNAVDMYVSGSAAGTEKYGLQIGTWRVSKIRDFSSVFDAQDTRRNPALANFNEKLSSWDVSSAVNMSSMFRGLQTFSQDISSWNTSRVQDMSHMFDGARAFNRQLSPWDVSNVISMESMFANAASFNQNISLWNTSCVQDMSWMFYNAPLYNQPLTTWDVSQVESMNGMFMYASSFDQDISSWDVSKVQIMSSMFSNAAAFNQNISSWNTSSVQDMSWMFCFATAYNQPLRTWDVSHVVYMHGMFNHALVFDQDLSSWDVSQAQFTPEMFSFAVAFNHNISSWQTSSVQDMGWMFYNSAKFNQPLRTWDISNVVQMFEMFKNASSFNQDLCSWGNLISDLTNVSDMFVGTSCISQERTELTAIPSGPFCHNCL